jgi:hypothetical protein
MDLDKSPSAARNSQEKFVRSRPRNLQMQISLIILICKFTACRNAAKPDKYSLGTDRGIDIGPEPHE